MKIFTIATLLLLLTVSFAAENNAEALFLLGRAYLLGRGVMQDNANQYYEQTRALGSTRANHII